MATLDFQGLVDLARASAIAHLAHSDKFILELSKEDVFPAPTLVRWQPNRFPQIFQIMIVDLLGDQLTQLEAAVTRLNFTLEIPVFELVHSRRVLQARIAIPVFEPEGLTLRAFEGLRHGCVVFAKTYLPAFQQVVKGAPGAEIEKLVAALPPVSILPS